MSLYTAIYLDDRRDSLDAYIVFAFKLQRSILMRRIDQRLYFVSGD